MRKVRHKSPAPPSHEARPWLEEKVYGPRRQHTTDLTVQTIRALESERKRVSLSTIVTRSREKDVDPSGEGVSESGIRGNDAAYQSYREHRTWSKVRLKEKSRTPSLHEEAHGSGALD